MIFSLSCILFTGYTALHHASCWGKVDCIKSLVENGASIDLKTTQGERARECAQRYGHSECMDYLDWAGELFQTNHIENK